MKILKLHAENVKRLKAVDITPEPGGHVVAISGRNNQGKSSVLDSIVWALGGTRDVPARPIRDGEDRAEITIDIGDDGDPRYKVTRTWTSNEKSYLRVESAEGAKFASPQKMLDDLIGKLSFDPLEFARLGARERRDVLRSVAEIPIDLDELEARKSEAFDSRRDAKRELARLEGALASCPVPPDGAGLVELSAAEVAGELTKAAEHNARVREAARRYSDLVDDIHKIQEEIARLQERLRLREAALEEAATMPVEIIDEQAIRDKLQSIEQTNASVRMAKAHVAAVNAVGDAHLACQMAEAEVDRLDQQRQDALQLATFPVEGLGLDDGDVTFEGLPFGQLSSSAQLRISLGIAMAMNPKLRVIRITDGSLLDSESMAVVQEMVAEKDYQVWIEIVNEDWQVGVFIEDGQVKA